VPVLEVVKRQPKEIVLTALVRMAEQAPAYVYFAFIFTYGMNVLHASRNFLLVAVVVAAAVDLMLIPVFGSLSDRASAHVFHRRAGHGRLCRGLFPAAEHG
jgi:hypothetical protein